MPGNGDVVWVQDQCDDAEQMSPSDCLGFFFCLLVFPKDGQFKMCSASHYVA